MIIKTKKHIWRPHIKTTLLILLISIIPFSLGYIYGEVKGWSQCVNFGINFINFESLVDKELIRDAILTYKSSLGGWAFDEASPFYLNGS